MGKKPTASAPKAAAAAADVWECTECGEAENDGGDACASCEAPRPCTAPAEQDAFDGFCVGLVQSCEPLKDKLRLLKIDVGTSEPVSVVTNASNAVAGSRVVVACVGAVVRSPTGDVTVKKAVVGGAASEGMLCDAPMLGWTGGGAGAAALVPESFAVGSRPPVQRPRMDGK